jgi:biopolymer transport protein ExbD
MFSSRFRHSEETNVEIDMVPVMNMFLVLIPFLLISSSFLNLKAINTSIPVRSQSSAELTEEQSEVKLRLMVTLSEDAISVKPMSDELSVAELEKLDFDLAIEESDALFTNLTAKLSLLKKKYPNSDTMVLSPEDSVPYSSMVRVMDAARGVNPEEPLFAKVVISGILK